jgi:hypothetical protein
VIVTVKLFVERAALQCGRKLLGLAANNGFVDVEVVEPTDRLAIGVGLGHAQSGRDVSIKFAFY